MGPDTAGAPGEGPLDVGGAETGLALLIEASERAVEELGSAVPPAQIRALLIIDPRRAPCSGSHAQAP